MTDGPNLDQYKTPNIGAFLAKYREQHGSGNADKTLPFYAIAENGESVYGKEKTPCDPNATYEIPMDTMSAGYGVWANGKKETVMARIVDGEPVAEPNDGKEWKPNFSFHLACLEQPQLVIKYDANNSAAQDAFLSLTGSWSNRPHDEFENPVVRIFTSSFSAFGRTHWKPNFIIDDWRHPKTKQLLSQFAAAAESTGTPANDTIQTEVPAERAQRRSKA